MRSAAVVPSLGHQVAGLSDSAPLCVRNVHGGAAWSRTGETLLEDRNSEGKLTGDVRAARRENLLELVQDAGDASGQSRARVHE